MKKTIVIIAIIAILALSGIYIMRKAKKVNTVPQSSTTQSVAVNSQADQAAPDKEPANTNETRGLVVSMDQDYIYIGTDKTQFKISAETPVYSMEDGEKKAVGLGGVKLGGSATVKYDSAKNATEIIVEKQDEQQ